MAGLASKDAVHRMAQWDYTTLEKWVAVFVDACLSGRGATMTPHITLEIMHTVALTQILALLDAGDALRRMVDDIQAQYDYSLAPLDVGCP